LNKIYVNTGLFEDMYNMIHVDESWFYLRQNKEWVRQWPGDEPYEPLTVHHTSHIPKVMFLTAVARPVKAHNFNGMIGLWRICNYQIATKKSKFHNRGDVYVADCNVTAQYYRNLLVGDHGVMQSIREKMPWMEGERLFIQHDGASAHDKGGNKEFFETDEHTQLFNIGIIKQPAQSPDLNVNDLGFFRSLKCQVDSAKDVRGNLIDMIALIEKTFDEYDADTVERIFAHLVEVYRSILHCEGNNNYANPHADVRKRQLRNDAVIDLSSNPEDCEHVKHILEDYDRYIW
jgi:hypothetical protein